MGTWCFSGRVARSQRRVCTMGDIVATVEKRTVCCKQTEREKEEEETETRELTGGWNHVGLKWQWKCLEGHVCVCVLGGTRD